jgi:hypothetical protein
MALRELEDEAGIHWVVFEVRPSTAGRAPGGTRAELAEGWLCFQSDGERRRLPGVPNGWESLSDLALLAMLARAPSAPRPRRLRGRR